MSECPPGAKKLIAAWTWQHLTLMANQPPSPYHAANRAIVETSLKAIDATKEIIRDYTRQDEALAQDEPSFGQKCNVTNFQREKIKEIVDAARAFQEVMERVAKTLTPPSPFRRLPAEILLEVFLHAVNQEAEHRKNQMERWGSVPFGGVPIILASVCSQWRAIVLQNPTLWEHIVIPTLKMYPMNGKGEELVARRVARWKVQGVQHKQALFIESWNNTEMERLISHTGSHAAPWRSIDVAISYSSPTGCWDAQSVYATKVKLYRWKRDNSLFFFLPLIQKASELAIMGTPPWWGNKPLTCLISLTLQPFATKEGQQTQPLPFGAWELCELLNASPCLKELQLDFTRAPRPTVLLSTPISNKIEHKRIESLSLHLHHISDNMGLFGLQANMPSLRSLAILSLQLGPSVLGETGGISISKWDHIRVLSLCGLEIAGLARALTLFAHLPNVDTFNVSGLHTDALIRLMNINHRQLKSAEPDLPLPQLTRVVLRSTDIQGGTLIDMVQTRLADMRGPVIVRRITEVDIYDSPGVALVEWKYLQTLLERGRALAQIGL